MRSKYSTLCDTNRGCFPKLFSVARDAWETESLIFNKLAVNFTLNKSMNMKDLQAFCSPHVQINSELPLLLCCSILKMRLQVINHSHSYFLRDINQAYVAVGGGGEKSHCCAAWNKGSMFPLFPLTFIVAYLGLNPGSIVRSRCLFLILIYLFSSIHTLSKCLQGLCWGSAGLCVCAFVCVEMMSALQLWVKTDVLKTDFVRRHNKGAVETRRSTQGDSVFCADMMSLWWGGLQPS